MAQSQGPYWEGKGVNHFYMFPCLLVLAILAQEMLRERVKGSGVGVNLALAEAAAFHAVVIQPAADPCFVAEQGVFHTMYLHSHARCRENSDLTPASVLQRRLCLDREDNVSAPGGSFTC